MVLTVRDVLVPNVPCGVERALRGFATLGLLNLVPNVPCGVES